MKNFLFNEESGQGFVEYGLLLAFIAVAGIVAYTQLGSKTSALANKVSNALDNSLH